MASVPPRPNGAPPTPGAYGPDGYIQTDADRRYDVLFKRVQALLPEEHHDVLLELDSVVGTRMADTEDQALLRIGSSGVLRLEIRELDDQRAVAEVVPTEPCDCGWRDDDDHDDLLQIESAGFAGLAELVARAALWEANDWGRVLNPVDFADFAAEHSWRRPRLVHTTFELLRDLYLSMGQAGSAVGALRAIEVLVRKERLG